MKFGLCQNNNFKNQISYGETPSKKTRNIFEFPWLKELSISLPEASSIAKLKINKHTHIPTISRNFEVLFHFSIHNSTFFNTVD